MTPSEQSYREIPLTKGQVAKVSPHRFDELNSISWHARWSPNTKSWYAAKSLKTKDGHRSFLMSRRILGLLPGDKRLADHINGDSLDNRDENLRITDASESCANRRPLFKNNTSGYKGVNWHKINKKWQAVIAYRKVRYHLGWYEYAFQAAEAYRVAAKAVHGEFARMN